jgi:predicted ATPase
MTIERAEDEKVRPSGGAWPAVPVDDSVTPVTPDQRELLKRVYRASMAEPLDAGDPRYVHLGSAARGEDPVERMAQVIELSPDRSVQFFAGFPGTGKTTELMRLRERLVGAGYKVACLDMDHHLSRSGPVEVSDILMALADAFGRAMATPELLGKDMTQEGYWERLMTFLKKTEVSLVDVVPLGGGIEVGFRSDPTLRKSLRERLGSRMSALVEDVRAFFDDCLSNLKKRYPDAAGVVMLVDSIEHIRGSVDDAREVTASVDALFSGHADKLEIPGAHVVYTVPPHLRWARIRLGSVHMLPAVKVRELDGSLHEEGIHALITVVANRTDDVELFGDYEQLQRIVLASGGNLRDLLHLLCEVVLRASTLPVSDAAVDAAIAGVRAEYLPIANVDATRLARVAETHDLVLDSPDGLYDIERLVGAHLLILYRNGREWYDVHPLVRDTVLHQARTLAAESGASRVREAEAPPASPRAVVERPPAPAALTPEMRVTLVAENYRALRRVRWALPRGVSALVGPNGSGKTTLLDFPELLRHALEHDARRAIDDRGGPGTLRDMTSDPGSRVVLGVELDQLGWRLDLSPRGATLDPLQGEQATIGPDIVLDRNAPPPGLELRANDSRPLLRRFAELPEGAAFGPLLALLEGYRVYGTYDLAGIRANGSQVSSDEYLRPDGRNIFSVLRNWRDRRDTRPRWHFVLESLKEAFPDTFDDLDFEMAGQTVSGRITAPRPDVRVPTYFAANGWFVALLHLAAVASTMRAGAVAIDEVENGLHPYAIRAVMDAMRRWAEETGISIVLATHSPVVIDEFKDSPDHLFVMESGKDVQPIAVDRLHDPEWLAHFSLGDLYAHDEFGAQRKSAERTA